MAHIVRDLGALKLTTTSTTAALMPTNELGHLDDANNIYIFLCSSATALTSGLVFQVSMYDPADSFPRVGITRSSQWFPLSTTTYSTSGASAVALTNIGFRGLRVVVNASGPVGELNEPLAYVTKQISV